MLECVLLCNLDGELDPNVHHRTNFDRKHAVARFAEHSTIDNWRSCYFGKQKLIV
jgi:hypothetical protein